MKRKVRLQQPRKKYPSAPVTVVRPGVWSLLPPVRAEALRLAQGDAMRVEVLSPTTAIVHNGLAP